MQTPKTFGFDFENNKIFLFNSRREAESVGNTLAIADAATGFLRCGVALETMAALHNALCPQTPVRRFADRAEAYRRLLILAGTTAVRHPMAGSGAA